MSQDDKLQEWLDERAAIWTEATKLNDSVEAENRDMTPEEQSKWDKMNVDLDSLGKKIDRKKKMLEHERRMSESRAADPKPESRTGRPAAPAGSTERAARNAADSFRAFHGWALHQCNRKDQINDQHIEAAKRSGQRLDAEYFDIRLAPLYDVVRRSCGSRYQWPDIEARAILDTQTATEGLEWIPFGFVYELERAMLAYGGMRQVSRVLRTATGNDLKWPTMNDTTNTGELVAEGNNFADADPATDDLTLLAYKYSSKACKVTAEFLEDEEVNFASIVGEMLGTRIGRITNTHFTTGDGSGKPTGIVTAAGAGATIAAAGTNTTISDGIIDLYHSIDPAYRGLPGTVFMLHDTNIAKIRKIKDSQNQYIWQPGFLQGTPDRMIGVPVVTNQDMVATWAAADEPILYGAFSKYIIRDVGTIRVRRLVELYALADVEAFIAFSRHDGNLLNAGTAPIKSLTLS